VGSTPGSTAAPHPGSDSGRGDPVALVTGADQQLEPEAGPPSPRAPGVLPLLLVMVAGGGLVSLQARINGELSLRVHSGLAAAWASFVVGLVAVTVLVAILRPRAFGKLRRASTKWWYWIGGLGGGGSQWALATSVPKIGVSLASVGLAAGMTSGGLFADRIGLGLFGRHRLTATRLGAAFLAVGAVTLSAASGLGQATQIQFVVFVVVGGVVTACQQPINGQLGHASGEPLGASFVSFLVGTAALTVLLLASGPSISWPSELWLYTGGLIAATYVTVAIVTVGRLGALRLSLASIGGQLTGAALLDVLWPLEGQRLTPLKAVGAFVAFVAVALASGVRLPRRTRHAADERNGRAWG
jgi:bacterial/archaeal transporter family-2 protein